MKPRSDGLPAHTPAPFNPRETSLPDGASLAAVAAEWLREISFLVDLDGQLSPSTLRAYQYGVELLEPLHHIPPRDLDQRVIWRWYKRVCQDHGVSAGYWGLQRLRTLLAFARREGYLRGDPTAGLRARRRTGPARPLTTDELRAVVAMTLFLYGDTLRVTEGAGLRGRDLAARLSTLAVILVLACTGARVTEVCTAQVWQWEGDRIFFPRSKMGRARRVGVGANTKQVLALQASLVGGPREFLFPGPKAAHIGQPQVWYEIRDIQRRAWIAEPHASPHDLRHTFAIHALNAGVDPKMVAWQLGQKNDRMLRDVYGIGALPPAAARCADLLEDIAGGGEPWTFA